jgi:hypothetical protein
MTPARTHKQVLVQALAGIRQPERSCRRWQLSICRWIYEVICSSACTQGFATYVEAKSPPADSAKFRVLSVENNRARPKLIYKLVYT